MAQLALDEEPQHTNGTRQRSNANKGKAALGEQYATDGATNGKGSSSSAPSTSRFGSNLLLGCVFVAAILLILLLFRNFPQVSESDRALIKFPRSLADVRQLSSVLKKYRDDNFEVVLTGFCAVYIFLQTFAIPGGIFLSILSGPLFGLWLGFAIVSCVAPIGSSLCFLMSKVLGRSLVERCFPSLLNRFRGQLARHRSNLLFYLLFLRISPLFPNWFISISSPILDIPYPIFAIATFFGLMPANYLHVTTGLKLEELGTEGNDGSPVNMKALLFLAGIAFLALIPTMLKKKFEQFEANSVDPTAVGDKMENSNQIQADKVDEPIVEARQRPVTRSSSKKKAS